MGFYRYAVPVSVSQEEGTDPIAPLRWAPFSDKLWVPRRHSRSRGTSFFSNKVCRNIANAVTFIVCFDFKRQKKEVIICLE